MYCTHPTSLVSSVNQTYSMPEAVRMTPHHPATTYFESRKSSVCLKLKVRGDVFVDVSPSPEVQHGEGSE